MKNLLVWVCLLVAVGLAGCADQLTGDVYTREEARTPMRVRYGWVESVSPVVIQGDRGFIGEAGGAVIGGIAASTIGSGTGRSLASAVGAVTGAVVGGVVQEKATRAQGVVITVRVDGGEIMAIVQEVEHINEFMPGQRVRINMGSGSGRSHVMPLGSSRE